MEGWNEGQQNDPISAAIGDLLTSLKQNDAAYLKGEIERDKWLEVAKGIDDRLAVVGLRLAVRPWAGR